MAHVAEIGGEEAKADKEESGPEFSETYEVLSWVKERVCLVGFRPSMWTSELEAKITDFVCNPTIFTLIMYIENDVLFIERDIRRVAEQEVSELMYFITGQGKLSTLADISKNVIYGRINGLGTSINSTNSLLRTMHGTYISQFKDNGAWPESVKKDFNRNLHRFMATLTEVSNQSKGKTVLYIPKEEITIASEVAEDKDLVQRLESTVIRWTRQIKEVINNQDILQDTEGTGPLEEIQFWRSRTQDLSGISGQLKKKGVTQIVEVLKLAKSPYLGPFTNIVDSIQRGSIEANDNLKFLMSLHDPCTELAHAEPRNIPKILPDLLACIRMIWTSSKFYNTEERLTGLLRKVSSEIITCCCSRISLADILDGDVEKAMKSLNESINSGVHWKQLYRVCADTVERHTKDPAKHWNFDTASIFAQVDAFVQRCRDLLEICEGQLQFARRGNGIGQGSQLPRFAGTRGPEIAKQLREIEEEFERYVERLKDLEYDILDVKATRWHDDYNLLKNGMKDLEVMMQNVINSAFEGITSMSSLVELLSAFSSLAKRDAVKRCLQKKAAQVYSIMIKEMEMVRHEFDQFRGSPPLGTAAPKYSGSAIWARNLLRTVQKDWELLQQANSFAKVKEAEDAKSTFEQLAAVLSDYTMKMYQDWMTHLKDIDHSQLQARLEVPLMARVFSSENSIKEDSVHTDQSAGSDEKKAPPVLSESSAGYTKRSAVGLLVCNFDKSLLRLLEEVHHWEKFQGEIQIPYVAHDIANKKEELRVMREYVMLVVRDYNEIITVLNERERRLFQEHIRRLDRKIAPGISKLTWASKGVIDWYVRECRKHCADLRQVVKEFKEKSGEINWQCENIGATLLVRIDKDDVCTPQVFAAKQKDYGDVIEAKLKSAYSTILAIMDGIYQYFTNDPIEVQREWKRFQFTIDCQLSDVLRQTAKRSLQEFARAINGDAKSEPQSLFRVDLVLDNNTVSYQPSTLELSETVNDVSKQLLERIKVIPRILNNVNGLGIKEEYLEYQKLSFYERIAKDEEILKLLLQIMNGIAGCVNEMKKHLSFWDKYKPLWEMDKGAFIRRYAKTKRPLSQYEIDITRYRDLQKSVQAEDMATTINFMKVDCTQLKASLVGHCIQWQNKLTNLLNENVRTELVDLHSTFDVTTKELTAKPLNLDELSTKINLLKKFQDNQEEIESRFKPVQDTYATLVKFDVQVSEDEQTKLNSLLTAWGAFKHMIEEAAVSLASSKQSMKKDLESALSNFSSRVESYRAEVTENLPFNSDLGVEAAFERLNEFAAKLSSVRETEARLKPGLNVFELELPDCKELMWCETEIGVLTEIWSVTREWNAQWQEWKDNKFDDLDINDMELSAQQYNKKVGKLGREKGLQGVPGGAKQFGAYQALKELIDQFRQTLPLIQDLKNPAIRPRHWESLKEEIQKQFDPFANSFTLSQVFSLGLHLHGEFIGDISANANKEMAIEQALEEIANTWATIEIEMAEFKTVYWKVRSTEDMFAVLEDNQVSLSTMKASKFFLSFQQKIEHWEKTLSTVGEVVELLLQVQRQWMYLESIFMASEDIKKQLPSEATLFEQVNDDYKSVTDGIVGNPIAIKACKKEGVLEKLTEMDLKLEKIQKSLDQYLETKRQAFPRFYFLSNDDLLEILGQQKDPTQVQKHIKKCFVGIATLVLLEPGKQGNKTYESTGMISNDGEKVPLARNCVISGAVESWLNDVEANMFDTVAKQCSLTLQAYKGKKEKWIKDWPGQLLITVGAISWTAECTRALETIMKGGNKSALRQAKKKQVSYLNRLSDMVRGQLSKIERRKLVALITMEIHNRDVQDRMIKANTQSVTDFDWLCQLRFYWDKEEGEYGGVVVRQTNQTMEYGYEYQGNNGRLVVTPLTDRCVLTLVTALALNRGGAPAGPAGTGKTETVKDLGKNLAKYVVVFNCSDAMDYKSVGRMFSGLVQTGGWGCFDEFNRIQIEVLSVIAQQVMSIMNAIAQRKTSFNFMGTEVRCRWSCGIFITMNPGYAGRTELPDNLKSLFRPVSMMVPDLALIAEVMLAAEGFKEAKPLAKKTTTLYALMVQQLSKQDHYDFGLRSLRGVLMCAGALKREDPELSEELILLRALRDMNVPKFIREDMELFMLLINDLFPGMETPPSEQGKLQKQIEIELEKAGFQPCASIIQKAIQLYESKCTRHCNMCVGRTLAGKSVAWKMLAAATTAMAKEHGEDGFQVVRTYVLNPKSVSMNELYGAFDLATFEWTDGILSNVFRSCAQDERKDEKWIVLDGPVDTLWIESMNTVMDDNKTLTLINGDRISMSASMSLLFEVRDLAVASPATVSRAGMIYLDVDNLGWEPFVTSWVQKKTSDEETRTLLLSLFNKYCVPTFEFKRRNVNEPVPVTDFNAVRSLCNLFDTLATPSNGVCKETEPESFTMMVEKWFAFCVIWSLCAAADSEGRKKLDGFVRDVETQFPPASTIYDYFLDVKSRDWKPWDEKVPNPWRPQKDALFFEIIVPTVDTTRNTFVVQNLVKKNIHTMLVGTTGTGKTVLSDKMLQALTGEEGSKFGKLVVNFSSATSSLTTQEIIEGSMEKRSKDKFGPPGGKQLICFVDDFNMPRKDLFGSQPPLELLRQWIDYGGWYERAKQTWRFIQDMQLLVAMGPPGGGRAEISERLQSRFNLLNFTPASIQDMERIFTSILVPHLVDFEEEIKPLGSTIIGATVSLYHKVIKSFLPTPAKCHYLFNMRDVAKVTQGLLQGNKHSIDTKESMLRLWVHEASRVLCDRFISQEDIVKFKELVNTELTSRFSTSWENLMAELENPELGPRFSDFLGEPVGDAPPSYEEVVEIRSLKAHLEEKLEDYNMEPGFIPMDLVLFKDAIGYVCRIGRVLGQMRGNLTLVGIGGSGRQSLSRLAAYTCEQKLFSIEITKQYRSVEFHEDLKALFLQAGGEGKATTFLFSDTQIKEESFLEDVNNILSSGEVPNLFTKEEKLAAFDYVRPEAKKAGIPETADNLWELFISRTRNNLHVVLCMSPTGDDFRNRCRMYPALVSGTTIIYFHPWPQDALREVAAKFLEETKLIDGGKDKERSEDAEDELSDEVLKPRVGTVFALAHQTVAAASANMLLELKRNNYVTPTNFLELVKSYRELLTEKMGEIGESRNKLIGGLSKLEEGKVQVEEMSVELEKKKVVVAQAQKDCEELLVVIVSERRSADERKQQVEAQAERISKEEIECKKIADDAEADLGKALPALERAMQEVDKLDKSSISEVKAYASPPPAVEMVLNAVMLLFNLKPDWATAKRKIGEPNFLVQIKSFDKDNVSNKSLAKLSKFTKRADFTAEEVGKKSQAAAVLCTWVLAIELYSQVFREVAPKRLKLKMAMDKLSLAQGQLKAAQEELAEVIAKVEELNNKYQESVGEKNRLRNEAEGLEAKLDRADKLVSGLSGERVRWESSIGGFDVSLRNLVGDALVAAAFLSYAGPFDTAYRNDLVSTWLSAVKENGIPHSDGFQFTGFLANATDVRNWNLAGLPSDDFSTENGVITTRGRRWPLMIDPQNQANKWIKNAYPDIVVCNLKMADFIRKLETCIQFGTAYMLQDVEEELDPAIDPVLTKSIVKVGNRSVIKLGDKEIDYSEDFRFFITTKLGNPHYTPEVSTKVTLVNFSVKLEGLEAQLLGEVVRQEEPELEAQKAELVVKVAEGKNSLVALENSILKSLAEATGSLLEDEALVDTLQVSKKTSEDVVHQLKISEETEGRIDSTRQGYKPVATRAAILYFVLNDLSSVDPMYQFSLSSYVDLFNSSIVRSRTAAKPEAETERSKGKRKDEDSDKSANPELEARITAINSFHTYEVYCYACRGLFERHKLLLSLQICFQTLKQENLIPKEELDFFLRGGQVMDRTTQRQNPAKDLIDALQWDNICELDKVGAFQGLATNFEQNLREWKSWYLSPSPESESLPGEWDNKLTELQRLLVVRSLRVDRTMSAATNFVANNLGPQYVEPPPFDLNAVFQSSSPGMPLIFVLSPGVDPTKQVYALAEQLGFAVGDCSLGQGQAPVATKLINDGLAEGNWVFLANCHLAASWLPTLEKIIEDYCDEKTFHTDFRLWLSSSPTPKFPLTILQRGLKMTTEPPKGLKANLRRLYDLIPESDFERCTEKSKYKKLLFCLAWFHSLLLERRKFLALGWNIPYDFNDADFLICENIIAMYVDEYPQETPWDAIRYLIAQANYGGRITDDWDRRLCLVYVNQLFNDDAIETDNFQVCDLQQYYIPDEGRITSYKDYIAGLPLTDHPVCFGQHPNADVSSMMTNANMVLDTLLALQPRVVTKGGQSNDEKVLLIAKDLQDRLMPEFDMYEAKRALSSRSDPDPLKSVLLQEIDRYSKLLRAVRTSLLGLDSGIKGLTVITSELENIFDALLVGKVPDSWSFCYPSLKPLGSWIRDLTARCQFFQGWLQNELPKAFWLSGFTYPTGFLTGLLQTSARKNGISIDTLAWEFPVLEETLSNITQHPTEGAYIYGMFLEGARWDNKNQCLTDANPLELIATMPTVHFQPSENKKKTVKGVYVCPLYLYPIRTGTRERPSFMLPVDIRSGDVDGDYWTKRGTALLLSTST